jgi:predicted ribosome quality control (RQC) complex YloA/Tae2 family protein
MFKPFLKQLTKVTDLTILFATIFVFLAFITPEELSQVPLNNARDDYDRTASSLALAESKVISSRIELEESIAINNEIRNSIAAAENVINSIDTDFVESVINDSDTGADLGLTNQANTELDQANTELDQANTELDQANTELDKLNTELVANESQLKLFREASEEASKNVVLLQSQLNMIVKTIADIETAALSSRSISWLQPVRKNTSELTDAAGMDGLIAGFAALIFCLVCRRRETWFKQMFGIYFR